MYLSIHANPVCSTMENKFYYSNMYNITARENGKITVQISSFFMVY